MESATENIPSAIWQIRVKRWCKRPPVPVAKQDACKPHPVQDQVNPEMWSASFEGRVDRMILSEMKRPDE